MPIKYLKRRRHGTQEIVFRNEILIAGGCGNRCSSAELNSIEVYGKYDKSFN